jgi:hypothetical protein
MKSFLFKLAAFLLPILLVFIFPLFVFHYSREFYSLNEILAVQKAHPEALFGLSYGNFDKLYKRKFLAEKSPAVIALGTSKAILRVMIYIAGQNRFLNTAVNLPALKELLQKTDGDFVINPEVLTAGS